MIFLLSYAYSQDNLDNTDYDSLLIDSKAVEMFNSLTNSKFFHSTLFNYDKTYKTEYVLPTDYVPKYNDSIVKARIAKMNAESPLEFRYNAQVKSHIDFYLNRRAFLSRLIGLSQLYFPLFEEQLDKHMLPLELKYVVVIESAFNPIARSRAGASGLWQFMYKTGLLYGLQVDSYVDDRFDPYKATVAACEHFVDLYEIFNDWNLVLVAYNAGSGKINRAMKRANNVYDYWSVQSLLPRETQRYVPGFIAAAYVIKYHAEHNIIPMVPVFVDAEIDTVSVNAELSFNVLSSWLDISQEELELLNPAYKRQLIPEPNDKSYILRLPKKNILNFIDNELDMYIATYANKYPKLFADYFAKDTIAKNIDDNIIILSEIVNEKTIQNVADLLELVRNHTPEQKNNQSAPTDYHIVRRGENLGSIARKYGCTVNNLMNWNNLSRHTIHPGQKLIVRISSLNNNIQKKQTSSIQTNISGGITYYTVQNGDTLWDIARKHGTSVSKIQSDNNISNTRSLRIGQRLIISN